MNRFRRWWFYNVVLRESFARERTERKNAYDRYLQQAQCLGIQALAFGDWCGIHSIPKVDGMDYNEFANNVALGMYPVCKCGKWMHQHENFTGGCAVFQEFRFDHYQSPLPGREIPVSLAFNQAIFECD